MIDVVSEDSRTSSDFRAQVFLKPRLKITSDRRQNAARSYSGQFYRVLERTLNMHLLLTENTGRTTPSLIRIDWQSARVW